MFPENIQDRFPETREGFRKKVPGKVPPPPTQDSRPRMVLFAFVGIVFALLVCSITGQLLNRIVRLMSSTLFCEIIDIC